MLRLGAREQQRAVRALRERREAVAADADVDRDLERGARLYAGALAPCTRSGAPPGARTVYASPAAAQNAACWPRTSAPLATRRACVLIADSVEIVPANTGYASASSAKKNTVSA